MTLAKNESAPLGGHRRRNALSGMGVALILVVGGGGYEVLSNPAIAARDAVTDRVIKQVEYHQAQVGDVITVSIVGPLNHISDNPAKPDFDSARKALNNALPEVDRELSAVRTDQAAVRSAQARIGERSVLTALGRSSLERDQRRLSGESSALDTRAKELTYAKEQLPVVLGYLGSLTAVVDVYNALHMYDRSSQLGSPTYDVPGVQAKVIPAQAVIKRSQELAQASSTPQFMHDMFALYGDLLSHVQNVLSALKEIGPGVWILDDPGRATIARESAAIDADKSKLMSDNCPCYAAEAYQSAQQRFRLEIDREAYNATAGSAKTP